MAWGSDIGVSYAPSTAILALAALVAWLRVGRALLAASRRAERARASWREPREDQAVTFLPPDQYALVERSVPLTCVDFVPIRRDQPSASLEVGLILRESPFGRVWCHLGGRILRGESIRGALLRHADDTLRTTLELPDDPQPQHVFQWFPPDDTPTDAPEHGDDPRKHAIGLSFLVRITGDPRPQNEAIDFAFCLPDALPEPLWPGTRALIERMLRAPNVSVT